MKAAWDDINGLKSALSTDTSDLTAVQVATGLYEIADATAREGVVDNRERIDALQLSTGEISTEVERLTAIVQGGVNYRGKTTEPLTDGSTQTTISVDGGTVTVIAGKGGDMVIVPADLRGGDLSTNAEFIWDGAKWNEFGTAGDLKALAYKDTASADYTPAGGITVNEAAGYNA